MRGLRFCLALVLAVVLLVSASDRFAAADLVATSDQLVNIGYTEPATGQITSFNKILANGTTKAFAIPAGKVFVVTRVQCGASAPGNVLGLKLILQSNTTGKAYFKQGMDSIYYDSVTTSGAIRGENYYPGFPTQLFKARLVDGAENPLAAGKLNIRIFGYLADIPTP